MAEVQKRQLRFERFGLESIPQELQQTRWYEYSFIQATFSVNAGNFLVPALAVLQGHLSILAGVLSTTIGAAVAFLLVSYLSLPGARYGIPAQYAMRSFLGVKGAQWISSPIRTITSLYWFSVQTVGGSYVIQKMLLSYFHVHVPFTMLAIILSTIMAILALIGFEAVKKVTKQFFPLLLIGQVVILWLFIRSLQASSISLTHGAHEFSFSTCLFYASLAFIQYISGVTSSSDITRYAKTGTHGFWGLYVGNVLGFMMTAVLATLGAGLFQNENPFIATSTLTTSSVVVGLMVICSMISMISINLSNAYTGGLSLLNSLPALGRIKAAILFGLLGIALSTLPQLVSEAKTYISMLGAFVVPLSAVIVAEFLWINKRTLIPIQTKNINKLAIGHALIGALIYFFVPDQYSPGFTLFVLTFISYGLTKRFVSGKARDLSPL